MSSGKAYPLDVPVINYKSLSEDIVTKYKYTYVVFASSLPFTAVQNTDYNGVVLLRHNYSGNNTYFIYSSFETDTDNQAHNIVVSDVREDIYIPGTWQFKWSFKNSYANVTGTLQFVIFFYTPNLVAQDNLQYGGSNNPLTSTGTPRPSNILSNLFSSLNLGTNDLVNFCPIISYEAVDYNLSNSGYVTSSISVQNYSSTFIVLTSIETQNGVTPTFNTRDLSAITIYNKSIREFTYKFHVNGPAIFKIIFIIMYMGV